MAVATRRSNIGLGQRSMEKIAKLSILYRKVSKVREFIIACKLYIRMREELVEE